MQTLIMSALLIAVTVLVVRQHFALRRLYKISQGQRVLNAHLNTEIKALSKDQMELRGTLNRRTKHVTPLAELPEFIQQPQTRYVRRGESHVN